MSTDHWGTWSTSASNARVLFQSVTVTLLCTTPDKQAKNNTLHFFIDDCVFEYSWKCWRLHFWKQLKVLTTVFLKTAQSVDICIFENSSKRWRPHFWKQPKVLTTTFLKTAQSVDDYIFENSSKCWRLRFWKQLKVLTTAFLKTAQRCHRIEGSAMNFNLCFAPQSSFQSDLRAIPKTEHRIWYNHVNWWNARWFWV